MSAARPTLEMSAHSSVELVGRDRELSCLREAHAAALAGQASVVVVSGESGMGKTALVEAFFGELRRDARVLVLQGRCNERESLPFKGFDAIVDALSRHLRRLGRDAAAVLPRDADALSKLFPVLQRLPVFAEAPVRAVADPDQLRRRAFGAFGELLARLRDRQPLVVAIDDAQWIDRDSTALLRYLASHPEPMPGLLVLAHRSEGAAENALLQEVLAALHRNAGLRVDTLCVGPLGIDAARALAVRQLGEHADEQSARVIAEEAGGSPFFIAAVASAVRRSSGAGHVTLGQAVAAHVARLSEPARGLLQVLAVAGRPLPVALALDAAAVSHDALDTLAGEYLARSASTSGEREVECYHDRIRESVGAALSAEGLCAVHAALAAALDRRSDADPVHLAVHHEGAGDRGRAAQHAVAAAERAVRMLAFDRAAHFYGRALELGAFDAERVRELQVALGDALANAARGADAADAYLAAADGCSKERALELKRMATEQLLFAGRLDRANNLLEAVLQELGMPPARSQGAAIASFLWQRSLTRLRGLSFVERPASAIDPAELARLDVSFACVYSFGVMDNIRGAIYQAHHLRAALATGEVDRVARALALEYAFTGRVGSSTAARAAELYRRSGELATRSGAPSTRRLLLATRAIVEVCNARWASAIETADAALLLSRNVGHEAAFDRTTAACFLAYALFWRGDLARFSRLVRAHVEECTQRNDVYGVVSMSAGLPSAAWLVADQPDECEGRLEQAGRMWPATGYQLQNLYVLIARAHLALYRGDGAATVAAYAAEWQPLLRSQLFQVKLLKVQSMHARGAAAALAARSSTAVVGLDRRALLAMAEQSAVAAGRTGVPALSAANAASVRAAIACTRGDVTRAAAELERAAAEFTAGDMAMYAAAHRRRLGALLGGDEGKRMRDEATAAMLANAVVSPDRMTDLLAPGTAPP